MKPSDSPARNSSKPAAGELLELLDRPLTIRQIAGKLNLDLDTAGARIRVLRRRGEVRCLNPGARRGRAYLRKARESHMANEALGPIYGWACFRHRSAVLKALDRPRRAVEIKRRARYLDHELRMSANNVRDMLRLMVRRGLVQATRGRRRRHRFPLYALTALGKQVQLLLLTGDCRTLHAHEPKPPHHTELDPPPDREGSSENRR